MKEKRVNERKLAFTIEYWEDCSFDACEGSVGTFSVDVCVQLHMVIRKALQVVAKVLKANS